MRRLTAALVLLALLLCGCVWSARSVERVCKNASDALRTGDLAAAHAIWEDAQPLLGALLPHEEIDETGLLLSGSRPPRRITATSAASTAPSCSRGWGICRRWKKQLCGIFFNAPNHYNSLHHGAKDAMLVPEVTYYAQKRQRNYRTGKH